MACFLVPAAEAIVTTIATKVIQAKEKKPETVEVQLGDEHIKAEKTPFSKKLKWLNKLLWGGSVLLAFEHLWHGEVTPWFPFLTAASNQADAAGMLHEMSTVGVAMAALVTLIWLGMLAVSKRLEKDASKALPDKQ